MNARPSTPHSMASDNRESAALSLVIFAAATGLMAWLRLVVFSDQIISLSYGLPLLVCLWHRDRCLLWGMAVAFTGIALAKEYVVMPQSDPLGMGLHLVNIVVIGAIIHLVINLLGRLERQRADLELANRELREREEEVSRQNEELQSQAEELHQQNEEIQQQTEELQEQTEELQSQADDLHQLNDELAKRQAMLEIMLGSLPDPRSEQALPERICRSLLELFDGAVAAAILERQEDKLTALAQAGLGDGPVEALPYASSLAAIIAAHDRTAFVADLAQRPDLVAPRPAGGEGAFRSLLATPLRTPSGIVGSVEVYSDRPRDWTAQHFRILEWAAAQCSLLFRLRRLHADLVATNAGLDRLVRERTAELQEMVNELEHFSYTITHDLRAPLRAMHGFSEMLAEESGPMLDENGRLYVARIASAAARMDRLITDALNFSKVVRHQMELTPQDPGALLAGMIESYPAFQPPLARIRVEGALPRVLANEAGLTQCFSNLLGNAVKFVARDRVPEVLVRAEQAPGRVKLLFEDNGIGIAPEMSDRVFGMFQRLSKDYEGTGIGLALVKKVAERMQGRIGFESTPGRGSRFWLEFKAA